MDGWSKVWRGGVKWMGGAKFGGVEFGGWVEQSLEGWSLVDWWSKVWRVKSWHKYLCTGGDNRRFLCLNHSDLNHSDLNHSDLNHSDVPVGVTSWS